MGAAAAMTDSIPHAGAVDALAAFLARHDRLVALTGAGISTESGLPDYRDARGEWKRVQPMRFQEFVATPAARRRYWSRALVGWRQFATVDANAAHRALAQLEAGGRVECVITQNVDGLHQVAGSRRVIDLHGRIDTVDCLGCGSQSPRLAFQQALETRNPDWVARAGELAPDGDAIVPTAGEDGFDVPDCERCGGTIKPGVVFFGESVPKDRVVAAMAALANADALFVAGTSLMVYSGYRFVRAARSMRLPVALLNLGRTRADPEVDLRIEARCGAVLPAAVSRLFA
jgi:NAD-dependent SIR2 family protein deacetylase